jgi:UDP-N-acetylglucosamine acyltransferase
MNDIHPTAIIEPTVIMGDRNKVLPYSILRGPLELGDDNVIGPHAVLGSDPADTRERNRDTRNLHVSIGNRNIIREFVSIQKPCYLEATRVASDCFIMQGASISHDVLIEDRVVITATVVVGGLSQILAGANLAMGCTIHQHTVVGHYSIVATGAPAIKNVRPFSRFIPGENVSVNEYAVKKFGFAALADQIRQYVLADENPRDPALAAIVAIYEDRHIASGRRQY